MVRGLIVLLVAPAVAAAQVLGPPVEPGDTSALQAGGGRSTFQAEAGAEAGADAGDHETRTDGALEAGQARTGAAAGAAAPATESLPLGAPSEALPLGAGASQAPPAARLGVGRTVISLAAVVAIAALLAAAYRQWASRHGGLALAMGAGGRAPSGVLEVLGRYPVSRGLTLVLLKIDRRVLLLAQTRTGRLGTGTALRALCELSDPEEVASVIGRCRDEEGESLAGKFRSMLRQFEATDEELVGIEGDEPLRLVQFSADGDRAELWDTGADGDVWEEDPYAQRGVG